MVERLLPEDVRTLLAKYGLVAGHVLRPASSPWRPIRVRSLLVTHDRRMLEAVAVTRRIGVVHGNVTETG